MEIIKETVAQAAQAGDTVLFSDPVHQCHNVHNDYCWQIKGKKNTKTALSNSGRERLTIIGAVNAQTQKPTILSTESNCDRYAMVAFLGEIRKDYPESISKTIYMFLDNARYNHSNLVKEEAKKLNIKLLYLPPYSPNLNIIERLWKFMKKKVTANRFYKTFTKFTAAIIDFFHNIGQYQAELESLLTLNFEII